MSLEPPHQTRPPAPSPRREAIVDIAAQMFAEQGFHAVSMRDIAQANNSSVASLYNHFASKDALLLAIGHRFFDDFLPKFQAAACQPPDGLDRVLEMIHIAYQAGRRHQNEFLTLSQDKRHTAATPELAYVVDSRDRCMALWEQALNEAMDKGAIQPGLDVAAVIWIIFSAIGGILDVARAEAFAGSIGDDPLHTLCHLLAEGLRPRPS